MAYQKVKTPRFYIDYLSYWKMLGLIDDITMLHNGEFEIDNILDLNPTEVSKFSGVSEENGYTIQITLNKDLSYNDLFPTHTDNGFVGLLGHNISTPDSGDYAVKVAFRNITDDDDTAIGAFSVKEISNPSILNSEVHEYNEHTQISKKGCTLYKAKPNDYADETLTFNTILLKIKKMDANETTGVIEPVSTHEGNFNINSFCMGHYYDMTNNPDLNVKVTTEFDGFDVTNTLGGSTITNIRYMGAPYWSDYDGNDLEPWAVGESSGYSKRNGRKSWQLKFSYVDQKDLISSNYMSNTYAENTSSYDSGDILTSVDGETEDTGFFHTIDSDESFSSRVLNRIGNGQRFIFQPNKDENNPSDFYIAMLDQDSVVLDQVANGVYNISLTIKEVW